MLQNAGAWAKLTEAAPTDVDADDGGAGEEAEAEEGDNLWNEFRSREQQQKKRVGCTTLSCVLLLRPRYSGSHKPIRACTGHVEVQAVLVVGRS